MATLAGQRAQFTGALKQYNSSDDPDERVRFARKMAKYIQAAPANGFTTDQVTQGQSYPAEEVNLYINDPSVANEIDVPEAQAIATLQRAVDTTEVIRRGVGLGTVYAYGYKCSPDRLKIGSAEGDVVQRIAAQIGTSTPDKPVLYMEIRTDNCRGLERALHSILTYRGQRVIGGGTEWFLTNTDDIECLRNLIETKAMKPAESDAGSYDGPFREDSFVYSKPGEVDVTLPGENKPVDFNDPRDVARAHAVVAKLRAERGDLDD